MSCENHENVECFSEIINSEYLINMCNTNKGEVNFDMLSNEIFIVDLKQAINQVFHNHKIFKN